MTLPSRRKPKPDDITAGFAYPRRPPEVPPPEPIQPVRVHLRPTGGKVRVATTEADLTAVPKPRGPWRSKWYRAYVRQHPCASCGTTEGIHAHHHSGPRGVSMKADDTFCVPLCGAQGRGCHDAWHTTGKLLGYPDKDRAEIDAHLLRVAVTLLTDYFCTTGGDDHDS